MASNPSAYCIWRDVHISIEGDSRKKGGDGASICALMVCEAESEDGNGGWHSGGLLNHPRCCGAGNWRLAWEEDRVKGSSYCYAQCDHIITVKTRCLFAMACQLLAVQGGRKRLRWPSLWKQSFLFLPLKYQVPEWEAGWVTHFSEDSTLCCLLALYKYLLSKKFKWLFAL